MSRSESKQPSENSRPLPIWVTVDEPEPTAGLTAFLRELTPYGVILFARHLIEPEQIRALNDCITRACEYPIRIGIDQEGGRVNRLRAIGLEYAGAGDLEGDPSKVQALAGEMGERLRDLGFHVDFAPVADLGPAIEGTGLEGRLYSDDPERVTKCCEAFLTGLSGHGIRGCLKHFPGLGGSIVDSHKDLPRIHGALEERDAHIYPYRRLAEVVPYVMMAHGSYSCLECPLPSSLDPEAYSLLRDTGFRGVSITDDLCMGAVCPVGPLHERAMGALAAGAGLALWVSSQEESLRASEILRGDPRCLAWSSRIPYPDGGRP